LVKHWHRLDSDESMYNGIDRSVGDRQLSISFTFKLSTIVHLQLPWAIQWPTDPKHTRVHMK